MRVITGIARGKNILTLSGDALRPTASRVKEGLFSAIQFDIEGRRVLDLFAGSGQLGIEALSRGAERAVFIDESAEAISVIQKNLLTTGLGKSASVARSDYKSYLTMCKDKFDIVFIDPPYHKGFYNDALTLATRVMSDYGMIICEYPAEVTVPETVGEFVTYKKYRYGRVNVSIYKKGE